MVPLQSKVLGCNKLSSIPLTVKTPEHFPSIFQTCCFDINRPLLTDCVHSNVENVGLDTPLDDLLLDHRHPVVARNGGLLLHVEHVPHLETAGGGCEGRAHVFTSGERASLPAGTHGVRGGDVRPGVGLEA